jgi:hypothetical protein
LGRLENNIKKNIKEKGHEYIVCAGFNWLRIGTGGGSCEHGNEPSGSINGWEFFDYLSKHTDF